MSTLRYPFLDLKDVNAPYLEEMTKAVGATLASGRYVGGAECERFEQTLAKAMGAEYAVGVSNGLDALRLSLMAFIIKGDLKRGDEVIVAANTYVASVLAIMDAGLTPVLAEPDSLTLNLDTSRLEEYLTERTRAVMPVHLYGRVCWDERLAEFVERHKLIVVEDNAQSIGASYGSHGLYGSSMAGALGHAGAFSFYPTKNIGAAGDAGAVVTHDAEVASIVRALANYGADRRYHNIYVGYNCRLDPVQAAVLNVKLKHIAEENGYRREIARIYNDEIVNAEVTKPLFTPSDAMVWHQYIVEVEQRDDFRNYLEANGVGTDVHYATPPHRQPALSSLSHGALPETEKIAQRVVSLPIARSTSQADAHDIAAIINAYQARR
jgi:dTDP-4-amino-4,6-dideoxygalactose transaminase